MKKFTFGNLSFDRNSIPDELHDLSTWPTVDHTALSEEDRLSYIKREEAMRLFVDEPTLTIREIQEKTGIQGSQLYPLFHKCIQKHFDGRIYGFRALIPYIRVKEYDRKEPVKVLSRENRGGASGAFKQLIKKYPEIDKAIRKEVKKCIKKSKTIQEIKPPKKKIHKIFVDLIKAVGVKQNEYPLNKDFRGSRSLYKYIDEILSSTFESSVAAAGGTCKTGMWPDSLDNASLPVTTPFEVVEVDGHNIDVRLTVTIEDPFGLELVQETKRIWILIVIEIASRCKLGYHLVLGEQYNKDDVVQAIQNALHPHRKRDLKIPGLTYRSEGGFPSEVYPELAFTCWDWLRLDNAKAHLSDHTLHVLTEIVGCWPDAGPIQDPNKRPFVESFFNYISDHLAHRIPGTTGSNPEDIRRKLGDPGSDISLLIEYEELEDLIDVMVSDSNGGPHSGIGGRTPLEAINHLVQKKVPLLRQLPMARRNNLCLLQDERIVTIRGNPKESVRPHINFEGSRYSNDILSSNPLLIGKKLRLYYNIMDLRTVKVFFEDGSELGTLIAARPWSRTKHSLRVRKEILKLYRMRKLYFGEDDDAVEVYLKYKRKKAIQDKKQRATYIKAKRAAEQGESKKQKEKNSKESTIVEERIKNTEENEDAINEYEGESNVIPLTIKKTFLF